MIELSRRSLMTTTAAALTATAMPGIASRTAQAAMPAAGKQAPGVYRYKIGSYEITAINDGTWYLALTDKFVKNASLADVQKALADQFLPIDTVPIPFTAMLVNTGSKLVADRYRHRRAARADGRHHGREHGRRRHRSEIHRRDPDLAFPSRPYQRHQDQRRREGFPECGDQRARGGMGVLDGRRENERGAGSRARRVPECAAHLQRHCGRGETLRTGQGSRTGHHFDRGLWPYAGTHGIRHRVRQTSRCSISPTSPTIRGCSCAIRNGRRRSTSTAIWRPTRARPCSTVPPPTR